MGIRFIIMWLLCTVAFAIDKKPATPMAVIECVVSGVLVAISIAFVPSIPFSG